MLPSRTDDVVQYAWDKCQGQHEVERQVVRMILSQKRQLGAKPARDCSIADVDAECPERQRVTREDHRAGNERGEQDALCPPCADGVGDEQGEEERIDHY